MIGLIIMVRTARLPDAADSGQWQSGLFGCFGHLGLCLCGFICPCCLFAKNAEIMGENSLQSGLLYACWPVFGVAASAELRGKIRERKNISGSLTRDVISSVLCPICTLVQEAREVATVPDGNTSMERA